VLLIAFAQTQYYKTLEDKLALPLYFEIRESLGLSPKLDSSIVAIGIDDKTVSLLGSPHLRNDQWVSLFQDLDSREPSVIMVDQIFTKASAYESSETQLSDILKPLKNIKSKIISASFIGHHKIPFKTAIDIEGENFDVKSYIRVPSDAEASKEEIAASLEIPIAPSKFVYGPDILYQPYLKNIGHIHYDGDSRFTPFFSYDKNYVIPHFALLAGNKPSFFKNEIFLNGAKIPRTQDGKSIINFSSYKSFLEHTLPMFLFTTSKERKAKFLGQIKKGDIVYIIPLLYTGNTDFKMTPFGPMPGGFTHLAILNSIKQKNWLAEVDNIIPIILFCAGLGVLIALKVNALGYVAALVGFFVIWFLASNFAFISLNLILPFLMPILSFGGGLTVLFVEKTMVAEKKAQFIRQALDGSIKPNELDNIARNPSKVNFEARERVVSVMFIDVVGFSLLVENQVPRRAFDLLKDLLTEITEIVHSYGGIVNKNLGDGLLCFFGYSLDSDISTHDHAEKSLSCALAIQRKNLPRTINCFERNEAIYPLRIGINTSSVYMGNLGGRHRLDFTVVGNGVNLAKRLEGACEIHSVLIGQTTKDLIDPVDFDPSGFDKKQIKIKHHLETIEAWQYDPFFMQPELKERANYAHLAFRFNSHLDQAHVFRNQNAVSLVTDHGKSKILSLASGGCLIALSLLLPKGSEFEISFDSSDENFMRDLALNGLSKILVEVEWSYHENGEFLHGVVFRGLNYSKVMVLIERLFDIGVKNLIAHKSDASKVG
jgi:class 3 adenylate cyclase